MNEPRGEVVEVREVDASVVHTPGVSGGEACIRGTRVPVWLLESYRRSGVSVGKVLDSYPHLTAVDLEVSRRYAEAHRDEIDRDIADHEAD